MGYYQAHPKDLKSDQFGPWSLTPSVHRFIKQFFFFLFFISPFTPSSPFSLVSISRLCLTLTQLSSSRWGLCFASESLKILFPSHGHDLLDCFWVFFFPPFVSVSPSLLQWLHQSSGIELIFLFPLPLIFDYLILHFWNLGFFLSFFGPSSVLLSFAFDWFCWRSILLIWLFLF